MIIDIVQLISPNMRLFSTGAKGHVAFERGVPLSTGRSDSRVLHLNFKFPFCRPEEPPPPPLLPPPCELSGGGGRERGRCPHLQSLVVVACL